jgi:hypothetical protein
MRRQIISASPNLSARGLHYPFVSATTRNGASYKWI